MAAAIAAAEARSLAMMTQSAGQNEPHLRGMGPRYSGHIAGLRLIRSNAQKEPERRAGLVDQQAIEAMLTDRARSLGIEVRRGCDVQNLTQQADGVDVVWASATGEGRLRCFWIVGCDGGRSAVRKMAGFDFPGCDPTLTMYQALAEVDHPEGRLPHGFQYTGGGMYGSLPGRVFMLDFSGPPKDRQAPVTHEEFESVLRRVSGLDVRVKKLENASRWTDNTRLVDTYRQGRVLLAGDAAHVHSPFGGQGMSLGLVDAANLGWKLAAVIRGELPESLLDTYTAERRPVAEAVLANTLAQTTIMRPDPQAGAMRQIMVKLLEFDDVNRFIGGMMSGLSARYDLGSDRDDVGRLIGNQTIRDGATDVSLYDLMQDARGILLDASPDGKTARLVAAVAPSIRCIAVETGPSLLIRPDGLHCLGGRGEQHRWIGRSAPSLVQPNPG